MGFMEDIGRSNALSGVNSLLGKAIEMRQMDNQSAEKAYTLGMEQEKFGLAKESHDVNIRKDKMALEEAAKNQKMLDSNYNITTDPRYIALPPEAQKYTLDLFSKNGWTDVNGVGTIRSARFGLDHIEKTDAAFQGAMGPVIAQKKNLVSNLIAQKNELLMKGEPLSSDKVKKYDIAIKDAATDLGLSSKNYETHLNELIKSKERGKVVGFSPDSNKPVNEDPQGNLTMDGAPYSGGQLKPVTAADTEGKAPTTRHRDVGDQTVTEEWSAKNKAWVKVSTAPRWNERGGAREDRLAKNQQFKNERDMRSDFEKLPEVKNFNEMNIKASQMTQAIEESKTTGNFVAVDQALITMFNKMTDPQSVVRESEYARTSNDIATVNMIKGKAMKVLTGGAGLTSDERDALKVMSDRFLSASKGRYDEVADEYRELAKTYGYEPNNVVFRRASKTGAGTVKTADEFLKKYGGKK